MSCKNCRHYVEPRSYEREDASRDQFGTCHRYPPSWVPIPAHVHRSRAAFPQVGEDDDCGEYQGWTE